MHRFMLALMIGSGIDACDSTGPRPPAVFVKPARLTLEDGQTVPLTAKLRNPTTRTVTWSSSNREVAIVDAAGHKQSGRCQAVVAVGCMVERHYEELAEALDLPLGTVRSRLSRTRSKLRAALAPAQTMVAVEGEQA